MRRSLADKTARQLATIPGIGAITGSAVQAIVPDPPLSFVAPDQTPGADGVAPLIEGRGRIGR